MSKKSGLYGDWAKAGAILRGLAKGEILPAFEAQLKEDGELVLKTMLDHISAQDLRWQPLSEHTIELKGGSTTIYVDTGFLVNNLKVRKVRAPSNGVTFFIGADAWTTTPSGEKFSDLMIWLEYGTDKMPARPLIRPSWEEVMPIIQQHWRELLEDLISTGGTIRE